MFAAEYLNFKHVNTSPATTTQIFVSPFSKQMLMITNYQQYYMQILFRLITMIHFYNPTNTKNSAVTLGVK